MAATFAHMSTVSPPRLTRQFQLASDPGLHHPPVLCCRETNLLPSLNAFLLSLYEKYTLLGDLSSGNVARHRACELLLSSFGKAKQGQSLLWTGGEMTSSCSNVRGAKAMDQSNGEIAEGGQNLWSVARA